MLTMIRNMLRSKLSGLLFLLIIVAMGAWGVTDVFSGGIGNNLAAAGKTNLSETNFDREVDRQLRTATDDRGRSLSKAQAAERGIVDQIYQRELLQTSLQAYAGKLGASATNEEVLKVIREDQAFATDTGTFDPQLYRALLDQNGFTPASFETFLKRDLSISRLRQTVGAGLQPPSPLTQLQAAYSGEERKAQWFILTRDDLPEADPVTDEDLSTYYEEQKDALRNPQRRRVTLLNLTVDDFLNQSEFSEDELRAFYESVKSRQFSGPDTRTWTEFVFASEEAARSALGRIAGGATPDAIEGLASSSDRTGPKTSVANAELADRLFGQGASPGGIFGPFETGRFFTVARLESITPGEVEPFDDVREGIVDTLSREQAIGLYYDAIARLDNLIGTGASLEDIGEEMGTPVLSFAPVDTNGMTQDGWRPGVLAQNPDILTRTFELTEGGKTARFGQDESSYILRVDEIVEPFTPDLEAIREDLRVSLQQQRNSEALSGAAQAVKQAVESGDQSLAEAAQKYDLEVTAPDVFFTRSPSESSGIPPMLASGVFSLREETEIYVAQTQDHNAVAIVQLVSIDRPDMEAMTSAQPATRNELQTSLENDLLAAFVSDIQDDVQLRVNRDAFEAYKTRVNPDT
jgi:peptidyl-prolyl cis-trans isomerase D